MPVCVRCGRTQATAEVKRAYEYSVHVVVEESFDVRILAGTAHDAETTYRLNGAEHQETDINRRLRRVRSHKLNSDSCGFVCRDAMSCLRHRNREGAHDR